MSDLVAVCRLLERVSGWVMVESFGVYLGSANQNVCA